MSSTLAPHRSVFRPVRVGAGRRAPAAPLAKRLVGLLLRLRVVLGRLVAWFAGDPQRIQVTVTAVAVCVVAGVVLGVGLGLVARVAVALLLSFAAGP